MGMYQQKSRVRELDFEHLSVVSLTIQTGDGRISMFINSIVTIPEPEPEPSYEVLSAAPSNTDYPLLNIVIQVVGSRGKSLTGSAVWMLQD